MNKMERKQIDETRVEYRFRHSETSFQAITEAVENAGFYGYAHRAGSRTYRTDVLEIYEDESNQGRFDEIGGASLDGDAFVNLNFPGHIESAKRLETLFDSLDLK